MGWSSEVIRGIRGHQRSSEPSEHPPRLRYLSRRWMHPPPSPRLPFPPPSPSPWSAPSAPLPSRSGAYWAAARAGASTKVERLPSTAPEVDKKSRAPAQYGPGVDKVERLQMRSGAPAHRVHRGLPKHLMREAIRCHQMQSEALRGSQRAKRAPTEPQRGNQRQSDGNRRQSEGNQRQSRGNQRQSDGNRRQSEGNQRQSEGNQRQSAHHPSLRERRDGRTLRSDGERVKHGSVPDEGSHQCPSVPISGALGRNHAQSRAIKGAYRLSVPTPKARCIGRNHAQSRGRTAYPSRPLERAVTPSGQALRTPQSRPRRPLVGTPDEGGYQSSSEAITGRSRPRRPLVRTP